MNDWIQIVSQNGSILKCVLKKPEKMDLTIFEKMANDEFCLRCVLDDPIQGTIQYAIDDLICLKDFLEQITFEKEEGYLFLNRLFECAISVNRNKPVLFDPSYVFVSPYGDTFYFLVVPLEVEEWLFQKDVIQDWVQYLIHHFQTTSAYEILGFMIRFLQSAEFSLPNLILGLDNLKKIHYPSKKRWFFSEKQESFRLKEPVKVYGKVLFSKSPVEKVEEDNKTQLIGPLNASMAFLEESQTHKRHKLALESMLIGRMVSCDIRLLDDSISLKHAQILCENDRYYIKDLKSLNKTYLNGKQVIRKMRLKEGMCLRLGNVEMIFHE